MKRLDLVIIFIIFFVSSSSWSQELESTVRPKIGLALSGGAAHGFAHIGVLKYLEELGIEVDYITGTSMGSVIGGLYALGFNAHDIRHIASQLNWDMIMSNGIPLNEVAPIEKPFHDKTPLSILWKGKGFKFPQGLIRGQKLDLVISRVYCPAHEVDDFDEFHIPFRCIGVDIENGSVDEFDQGFLGNAIRASMAIPTIFPPKVLNDRLYVDGGLIRNFPVEEVIDMGADYVIGVYVGSEKETREELVSMFDILKQATSMSSILDSERQAKLTDILVLPEVKDMGSFDFNDYEEFIDLGYAAAREHATKFKDLAKRLTNYSAPSRSKRLKYPSSMRFSKISTLDAEPIFEKMILNELKLWENYAVTLDQVDEGLSILYGTKNFSKAAYSFNKTPSGLELEVEVEEAAPFSLGFNANRFDLYNTAFILSAEARNVIGKPSNFKLDARISDNPALQGAYYIRLPKIPSTLIRLSGKAERFELPQYNGSQLDQLFNYDQSYIKIDLINEWKNKYLISAGYRFLHDELKPEILGKSIFSEYQSERNELFASINFNSLDKQIYATEGYHINLESRYTFNNLISQNSTDGPMQAFFEDDKSYLGFDLTLLRYTLLSKQICLQTALRSRYALGQSFLDSYRIGGPHQSKAYVYGFVGLEDSEIVVGNHISGELGLRFQLKANLFLTPIIQYIYGNQYSFGQIDLISDYGAGVAFDYRSPIGPISIDFGYSSYRERVIINLGLGYRHIF